LSETGTYENPLVPNKKLQQMYTAMAEMRLLEEHIAKAQKRVKGRRRLSSTRGQEACRVSTAIELGAGDLVSDSQTGVVMDLLAGAKIDSLLTRVREMHTGTKSKRVKQGTASRILPWVEDAGERLRLAMGAALTFKTLAQTNVVVAYTRRGEIGNGEWRKVLQLASRLELPIIFVILPSEEHDKASRLENLSGKTARWGVPGIPVEAGDAVALYRVAQESLGRARGGDGPALIECVAYRLEGQKKTPDPLVQMSDFLLGRKVVTKAWLDKAGAEVRKRIAASPKLN
jgi:TPP-dependent pyruvate/acetoin dehydrogenase alpha subunit